MTVLLTLLTAAYILCFQFCAVPAALRILRRRSSVDLSVWREWLILLGVGLQFVVMTATQADWRVQISPVLTALNVGVLLCVVYYYRKDRDATG